MSSTVKAHELVIAKKLREIGKPDKQTEVKVEGMRGLSIVVKPTGTAFWCVRFQVGRGDKRVRHRVSLGPCGGHGGLPLADAKEKAAQYQRSAEKGVDAVAVAAERAKSVTLSQLFAERKAKDDDTAQRTLDDYEACLIKDVYPEFGERPASEISPDEFARLLERIEDRAKHAAHKVRSALGSTYRWAQRRRLVTVNPLAGLAFTHQSARRKRVLTDFELARLWHSIDNPAAGTTEATRTIIKLAILTGQRNSEVAGAEVVELKSMDTATPRWDIPGRRMKRKSDDQYVPLSKQAAALFATAIRSAGGSSYVFPGTTHGRRRGREWRQEHIGQETVSQAMGRIRAVAGVEDVRLHDMRKCITSWLAEHGHATPEVLDAILHHGRKGVTGTHYNFALYEKQVRSALQVWADHVWQITGQAPAEPSNVVALHGVA